MLARAARSARGGHPRPRARAPPRSFRPTRRRARPAPPGGAVFDAYFPAGRRRPPTTVLDRVPPTPRTSRHAASPRSWPPTRYSPPRTGPSDHRFARRHPLVTPTRRTVLLAGAAAALWPALPAHAAPKAPERPTRRSSRTPLLVPRLAALRHARRGDHLAQPQGVARGRRPRPRLQQRLRTARRTLHPDARQHHGPRRPGRVQSLVSLRTHREQPSQGLCHRRLLRPHALGLRRRTRLLGRLLGRGADPRPERAGRRRRAPARRTRPRQRLPAARRLRRTTGWTRDLVQKDAAGRHPSPRNWSPSPTRTASTAGSSTPRPVRRRRARRGHAGLPARAEVPSPLTRDSA